jgi:plasmid maintenance system antidote protein VapI
MSFLPLALRLLSVEQREVAAAVHLHPSTLNRCLRGRQDLPPETIARLEAAAIELALKEPE